MQMGYETHFSATEKQKRPDLSGRFTGNLKITYHVL
jgi:hypothetical protein